MGTYQLSVLLLFLLFGNGEGTSTCAADVVILLDSSAGHHANHIGRDNPAIVCDFIENLIKSMNISTEGTRIAIAGVSHGRDIFHRFKDSQDLKSIIRALKDVKRMEKKVSRDHGDHCHTMEGLKFVRTHIFREKHGDRAEAPNVVILVTGCEKEMEDMKMNVLQEEVSKMKEMAHVIPVSLDFKMTPAKMDPIATSQGMVYDVEKASEVSNAVTQVLDDICSPPPSTP